MRLVFAILILLPAGFLAGLQFLMSLDAELWLAEYFRGFSRRDAFSSVNSILPLFVTLFCVTSVLAAYFVSVSRSGFLTPLTVAPVLAALV